MGKSRRRLVEFVGYFIFFMRRVIVVLGFARFVPLLPFALRSLSLHCLVAQ